MSTLNLWQDPFADVEQLVRTVFGTPPERPQGWTPASEVFRDGDDAVVRVELPGLDPATDVSVEIERGHLVIRGERHEQGERPPGRASVREMRYGAFRRVFRLPDHVTPEHLKASYDAGLLTVRVGGAYTPPRPVQVTIGVGTPAVDATSVDATSLDATSSAGETATAGPAPAGTPEGASAAA
jgi:HSP20 family protein